MHLSVIFSADKLFSRRQFCFPCSRPLWQSLHPQLSAGTPYLPLLAAHVSWGQEDRQVPDARLTERHFLQPPQCHQAAGATTAADKCLGVVQET